MLSFHESYRGRLKRRKEGAAPYMVRHHYRSDGKDLVIRRRIPDKAAGARKRLAAIMQKYDGANGHPALTAYVQTDPRGCALYLIRPGDVPAGKSVESYYSRGVAVY